ncbi:protein TILLER ANGLE CONTROL 1-like [Magnolia sinica]|uniref:protein TILLER ANGLE CONTROL 1-like n=1 Tax=Magnolia sinica TaxID=86752 RepID=UPI0026596AB7|nr:protein TILLER ANGLE CONTROL 1-like [Magnolia sinica]
MKIFDWMHRKFHPNVDYCMVSRKRDTFADCGKKSSTLTCDTDALLNDHVTIVDVLSGWQDGILTIGTFGLDQLKHFPPDDEYSVQEQEYSVTEGDDTVNDAGEAEEEQEEFHPSAVNAFKEELEKVFGANPDASAIGDEMLKPDAAADNPLRRFLSTPEFNGGDELEKDKKKKGERTTLADLFSADAASAASAAAGKCGSGKASPGSGKKPACSTKHVRSLAKKLMPWKGEESHPTRKIHRMVTKMLKRKIHPELDHEIHGAVGSIDAFKVDPSIGNPGLKYHLSDNAGNESISLLHDVVLEL